MYNLDHLVQLIEMVTARYEIKAVKLHDFIYELYVHKDTPVMRILFDEKGSRILFSFHVTLPIIDAIQIHNFIVFRFKKANLLDVYYVDHSGVVSIGPNAEATFRHEIEQEILRTVKQPATTKLLPSGKKKEPTWH